tara:strand:- start:1178 stop:1378 length:201 start_codon:yes stop_codon:yes gene_type:complete
MAKITINEKEYYTDDFNEDQIKAYNEIVFCNGENQRLSYNLQLLKDRVEILSRVITENQDESKEEA